jgi:hypothetical protein
MAGFGDNIAGTTSSPLSELSKFGTRYDDLLLKNSKAIGFIESQLSARSSSMGGGNSDLLRFSRAIADTTSQLRTKAIAFFQLDYAVKRERLRDIASNGEIEFILETITDDMVVYSEANRFCHPNDLTGKIMYRGSNRTERLSYQENILDKYNSNFEEIYNAWGFGEGIAAWQYAYQFLIEGHLSFEIIYDNPEKPKKIIGFKELDPANLSPQLGKDSNGKLYIQWIQFDPQSGSTRTLSDSQVIYISFANHFKTKRISFVERLVRSFNLLRVIEHSKVIWHVMNAPIRLQTSVPTGSKSFQKAQEDVKEFLNLLKEDVFFNGDTGELTVDGKPNILFYKNYVTPVNDQNQQVKIEPLAYPGPNLSNSELLGYFTKKLKMDSKIPYSRWEGQSGMGAFTLNSEGITREEVRYQKFIRRLRSAFSELIVKPWYLQMCMDFEDLKEDHKFNNAIGITYHNDNVFEEIKERELEAKRIASFTAKKGILKDDGTPYFSTEYLIRKDLRLTEDEIESNEKWQQIDRADRDDDTSDLVSAGTSATELLTGGQAPQQAAPEAPQGGGAETIEGGEAGGAETGGEGAL